MIRHKIIEEMMYDETDKMSRTLEKFNKSKHLCNLISIQRVVNNSLITY